MYMNVGPAKSRPDSRNPRRLPTAIRATNPTQISTRNANNAG